MLRITMPDSGCSRQIATPALLFGLQCVAALLVAVIIYVRRQRRAVESLALTTDEDVESVSEKRRTTFNLAIAPRPGEWLPPNHYNGNPWVSKIAAQAKASTKPLHPVLQEFQSTIENDPVLFMLFTRMFKEDPEARDPIGRPEVQDYKHMIRAFNLVISMGPPWAYTTAGEKGAVGAPITAIINWPMGTKAGREAFLNPIVNSQLKKMLTAWGEYLTSPDSASVLDSSSGGWLCEDGKRTMVEVATIHTHSKHPARSFEHIFECDPSAPNLGFKSWDDFFTRRFAPHLRPVAAISNNQPLIVNACESTPYRIASPLAARAQFWIKAQPYSLVDILADSPYAPRFVGGTLYQAYLSALSYHRWHAPVSGTVVKIAHVPGTYFAENYREPADTRDPVGPLGHVLRESQGYITEIAARMMIFIQADDARVGLVCAVMVGRVEVSSCESTVGEGQRVEAGEEIGMFHYGGSTHCLIFEKGRNVEFVAAARDHSGGKNVPVRARLATIV
jgi:phosphatidylserine decarboxylase